MVTPSKPGCLGQLSVAENQGGWRGVFAVFGRGECEEDPPNSQGNRQGHVGDKRQRAGLRR